MHTMKLRLLLLLAVVFSSTVLPAQEEEDAWPEAFSKHLRGKIGDKLEVEMQLQGEPASVLIVSGERQFRGQYWYTHKRIPIDLFGTEPSYSKVNLEEHVFVGGDTGWDSTGSFDGEFDLDGTFSGTWKDKEGKRKLPFKLSPYVPAGAVKTKAYALESSWSERNSEGASSLEHAAFVIQITDGTPAAEKINQKLLEHAKQYFAEDIQDGAAEEDESEKTDDAKDKSEKEKEEPESLTLDDVSKALVAERNDSQILDNEKWSYTYTAAVELNENGILCTSHLLSQYTGGAHPNSVTQFFVFDTKTGKELEFKSLFKPAILEVLPEITTEKLRKQEGPVADGDEPIKIEKLDFEEGDRAWFLSAAGLVIHFDPYAVAVYARGNVQATIPWAELEPWLEADSPLRKFLPAKK